MCLKVYLLSKPRKYENLETMYQMQQHGSFLFEPGHSISYRITRAPNKDSG